MGSLTTNKIFTHKAKDYAYFNNDAGEPTAHIEGIVEIAGASDINVDNTTVNTGGGYVGKSADGTDADFTIAYASPTTLTLSSYPAGVSGFSATDIETVRHIDDATGLVTATYSRDDAAMSITANTLTVAGAAFTAADYFVIQTNVPRPSASGAGGGAGGGSIVYTNAAGDFTATANNGAKTITITGLPFTLEEINVAGGTIKKIAVTTDVVTTLTPTTIAVAGGVITLTGVDDFATGDVVYVTLIGPDKWYDRSLDTAKIVVQNPNSAHYTDVETLISETNLLGLKGTTNGTDADTLTIAASTLLEANVAVGYTAWQSTNSESAEVESWGSTSAIETATLSGGATWDTKAYSVPYVQRHEIPMDSYNHLTLHYKLYANTFCNAYFLIYGTLNADATTTNDDDWVNMSTEHLGAVTGISVAIGTTEEDIVVIDPETPMLKYMVKLVVESQVANPNTNAFTVLIRKSA